MSEVGGKVERRASHLPYLQLGQSISLVRPVHVPIIKALARRVAVLGRFSMSASLVVVFLLTGSQQRCQAIRAQSTLVVLIALRGGGLVSWHGGHAPIAVHLVVGPIDRRLRGSVCGLPLTCR